MSEIHTSTAQTNPVLNLTAQVQQDLRVLARQSMVQEIAQAVAQQTYDEIIEQLSTVAGDELAELLSVARSGEKVVAHGVQDMLQQLNDAYYIENHIQNRIG